MPAFTRTSATRCAGRRGARRVDGVPRRRTTSIGSRSVTSPVLPVPADARPSTTHSRARPMRRAPLHPLRRRIFMTEPVTLHNLSYLIDTNAWLDQRTGTHHSEHTSQL